MIHGARKVDTDGIVEDFWLATRGDRIVRTGTGHGWRDELRPGTDVYAATGVTVVPGFIDLHVHGGGGVSFDDGPAAIAVGLATHRAHGTTRSLISLVSAPLERLERSLSQIADLADADPLVLGAHLEGPFLAPDRRGAHDPRALQLPDPAIIDRLLEASRGYLCQITIAPELPGAIASIDRLVAAGVVVAVGHTDADAETARLAFDHGATLVTHAFNAVPGIHHRQPGPLPVALADERVTLEIIADGHHLHPDVVRLAFDSAPGRIALITDAMAAAGAGDGSSLLGSLAVDVASGRATLPESDTLAGSTLTLDSAFRTVTAGGIDEVRAVHALTAAPARVLGIDGDFGRLASGWCADFILLDEAQRVTQVRADGHVVGP
ncbi:N-acetylglucosamine-6-phosphate deacetylase [Microbacterium sp. Leaf151]|nr:N-acetylglucosamine-6-phosphate deacetylase [Microbacterium sp. Leaf151]